MFKYLTSCLFFLAALTQAASIQINIAVSDLERRGGIDSSEALIISDRLREKLLNTGKFRVMERGMMDQILKEQSFQQTGACNASECQVQMGRLLGVDRLIVGSVGKIGAMYTIGVRMLDVSTGEIVMTTSQDLKGDIEDLLGGPLERIANQIVKSLQIDDIAAPIPPQTHSTSLSGKAKLRIGLGIGSTALLGTAFYFNSVVSKKNDLATKLWKQYSSATNGTEIHAQINTANDQAKSAATLRNVTGALAILGLAGIGLTFTF